MLHVKQMVGPDEQVSQLGKILQGAHDKFPGVRLNKYLLKNLEHGLRYNLYKVGHVRMLHNWGD